ncbi:COPII-coated vesicle component Sfb3 [Schizosaccharomyces japonicus yFS275]|uniref:COPII-coated vesicle component Sfb3 n=1 Tax=Schizosaccharomyces japonicus (strain yFS275 / FY16936) TaxID=402676 RepID=B6K282_SCHJY|nr:COPII-coated vesicle component Sfb3 [Schizosaccharomyces japonicus yFS275]EEB07263.1 COPII-coated vesicle component Sfb3 [Schizosaccharomyces japonicus yFS275]
MNPMQPYTLPNGGHSNTGAQGAPVMPPYTGQSSPEVDVLAQQMSANMNLNEQAQFPAVRHKKHRDAHAYDMSLTEPAAPVPVPSPMGQINAVNPSLPAQSTQNTNLMDRVSLPSVPEGRYADQQKAKTEVVDSMSKDYPPLPTTSFISNDQGNSSSKFVQMTTYAIPPTTDMLNQLNIPLGMIVQPFAEKREEELPVPVVDFSQTNPARCQKCRGYINPFIQFTRGGSCWICNLCGQSNTFTDDYYAMSSAVMGRSQNEAHPELVYGTVDFVVGKEYWVDEKEPKPMHLVFAIDVSYESIAKGLAGVAAAAIKQILYGPRRLPQGVKVSVIAFDRNIHFFNLSPNLEKPQMLSVPDLENTFVPFVDGLLVDPIASQQPLEYLLDNLYEMFSSYKVPEPAVGSTLRAAKQILEATGGKVSMFISALPTVGAGKLRHREDARLYGTEAEKTLLSAQDNFYTNLADEFVTSGICVDLFFATSSYVDIATVGSIASLTGGQVVYYSNFVPSRDAPRLADELTRSMLREQGYRVMMKTRCSNGLRVSRYIGNFFQRTPQDIEMGGLDADKAIAVLFKHEGKLSTSLDAHFQTAVLYTTVTGQRRVRVVNYCCAVATRLEDSLVLASTEPIAGIFAKEACDLVSLKSIKEANTRLLEQLVNLLKHYRKIITSRTSPGQLVLPRNLALLPIYVLGMLKSLALREGSIHSDIRVNFLRKIRSIGLPELVLTLYPHIFAIHVLQPHEGIYAENAVGQPTVTLPPPVRASRKFIEEGGAFLIVNAQTAYLWLHRLTSPLLLKDLLDVDDLKNLKPLEPLTFPELNTELNLQVRNILDALQKQFPQHSLRPLLVRQGMDGLEAELTSLFIEDRSREGTDYFDFLSKIYDNIYSK